MPYIFIHGLGQTPDSWNDTLSHHCWKGETVCHDLFSLLDKQVPTYQNLYKAFSSYCHLQSQPLHLCGLSLGAVLALQYAAEHAQKVASLVLIAPQYQIPQKLLKVQNFVFRLLPSSCFQSAGLTKQDMIQFTSSMMTLDFSNCLKEISCPVQILCGERDHTNKKAASQLAVLLPQCELNWIPSSGHQINQECPDKLAELLGKFYQTFE